MSSTQGRERPVAISLLARLNRPEYLFQPRAALRRLWKGGRSWEGPGTTIAEVPWSREITVFRDEIGRMIFLTGIFDLTVTETIHRLTAPGVVAVDVGANVGYLTSLMATRGGPGGRVVAFEPHPEVFSVLEENARRWNADPTVAAVEVHGLALSNRSGGGQLQTVSQAEGHMGLSSLEAQGTGGQPSVDIELAKLDDLLESGHIDMLKLDVEGHELSVLAGAERLLDGRLIRDLVFEEHRIYPAPSMTFLEERGMTLFTLKHTLFGPQVRPIEEGPAPPEWPGPNYLATLDPERALSLLSPRGWRCLQLHA
jgi:FkbM family methyltransferase